LKRKLKKPNPNWPTILVFLALFLTKKGQRRVGQDTLRKKN
jgi:hypothetical protein